MHRQHCDHLNLLLLFQKKERGQKNKALIDSSKEVDLYVNTEATKYMLKDHNIKSANIFFENVAKFRYLGMTVTNHNLIYEGIKSRLGLDKVCCLTV
jgi:hypothetical protein